MIERTKKYSLIHSETGFTLNVAGMQFSDNDLNSLSDSFKSAHKEMKAIESGVIKNPDENRQVTHFTDRIEYAKSQLFNDVETFVEDIRTKKIVGGTGKPFESVVINGIGGSALGPQLLQYSNNGPYWNEGASEQRDGYLKIYFLDNTDSSGFVDVTSVVDLEKTLVVSISKSGGTQETRNNMISFEKLYKEQKLDFTKHASAITMKGSQLDEHSRSNNWLKVFEMAESIGGRTSETSIVGHLPAALAGIDFAAFLEGACLMDEWTRNEYVTENPAYLLAATWFIAGNGKGDRNMVIVPYADRLVLLSRYFQQLVMESLGKELDLDGNVVNQGLNVFGNKGGTDAHAFIQQLNDGRDDFFITFIEVLKDAASLPIADGFEMGDYLHGFQAGLSQALLNKGRQVIQLTISAVDELNLGMIIALYERAVAVYAELINVNAFHQPGVQAYKLASKKVIDLQRELQTHLSELKGVQCTAKTVADKLNLQNDELEVGKLLAKFSENSDIRENCSISRSWNDDIQDWIYSIG
jgi:glucose-6-phosphate isomerase